MLQNSGEEKQILDVYDKWLFAYLHGDVKTYGYYFADDYYFIGSTNNEEFWTGNRVYYTITRVK